jgi:hypothetical protein
MDQHEIVATAADFLWSTALQDSIEAFTTNHVGMFHDAGKMHGEHRLEWTQAHRDFSELFDVQLEAFVETQTFTREEFVVACKTALEEGEAERTAPDSPEGFRARIVETVLMATTYEYFVQTMLDAAAQAVARQSGLGEEDRLDGTELTALQSQAAEEDLGGAE